MLGGIAYFSLYIPRQHPPLHSCTFSISLRVSCLATITSEFDSYRASDTFDFMLHLDLVNKYFHRVSMQFCRMINEQVNNAASDVNCSSFRSANHDLWTKYSLGALYFWLCFFRLNLVNRLTNLRWVFGLNIWHSCWVVIFAF